MRWLAWVPVVGASLDLRRVAEVDAWMAGRAKAPKRWDVVSEDDLQPKWRKLSSGFYKEVLRAATWAEDAVVVKRRRLYRADRKAEGAAALRGEPLYHEREVRGEVLYLEHLRGLPGVPALRGCWLDANGTRVTYVVDLAGSALGSGDGDASHRSRASKDYATFARKEPARCALALLECFRSFSEIGGFFLDVGAIPPPPRRRTSVPVGFRHQAVHRRRRAARGLARRRAQGDRGARARLLPAAGAADAPRRGGDSMQRREGRRLPEHAQRARVPRRAGKG